MTPLQYVRAKTIPCPLFHKRNDPYTNFSQQPHNKLMYLVIFYFFLQKENKKKTKRKQKKTKKIIKYYQPRQLVVELL
jgi:phosphotransferase system  glucose/maltose/N-acetylglucosamine-specific IIC component